MDLEYNSDGKRASDLCEFKNRKGLKVKESQKVIDKIVISKRMSNVIK
jgi:hypothetical protein